MTVKEKYRRKNLHRRIKIFLLIVYILVNVILFRNLYIQFNKHDINIKTYNKIAEERDINIYFTYYPIEYGDTLTYISEEVIDAYEMRGIVSSQLEMSYIIELNNLQNNGDYIKSGCYIIVPYLAE